MKMVNAIAAGILIWKLLLGMENDEMGRLTLCMDLKFVRFEE